MLIRSWGIAILLSLVLNGQQASSESQASSTAANVQLQKVARYVDAHLYPEACDRLRALLQNDEFDPGLRFALGEVLLRMEDYVQAARSFEVAHRLDKDFWQAAEREADSLVRVWETTRNLEARLAASQLYDNLLRRWDQAPSASALSAASLFGVATDLEQGRLRSTKQLEGLLSPVGLWTTEDNRIFKVTLSNGRWWLTSKDQTKYSWNVSFDAIPAPKLIGSGFHQDPSCLNKISLEASVLDFATRMDVDGFPTGESTISPGSQSSSMADARSMTRICQEMTARISGRLNGKPMYHLKLKRLQ